MYALSIHKTIELSIQGRSVMHPILLQVLNQVLSESSFTACQPKTRVTPGGGAKPFQQEQGKPLELREEIGQRHDLSCPVRTSAKLGCLRLLPAGLQRADACQWRPVRSGANDRMNLARSRGHQMAPAMAIRTIRMRRERLDRFMGSAPSAGGRRCCLESF